MGLQQQPMGVGGRIRALIQASGLQQKEVAHRSGIPQSSLSRLMTDDDADPRVSTILPIARALRVNLDDIVGVGEIPPSPITPYERDPAIRALVDGLVSLQPKERIAFEKLIRLFADALSTTDGVPLNPETFRSNAPYTPRSVKTDKHRDLIDDNGDGEDDEAGRRGHHSAGGSRRGPV